MRMIRAKVKRPSVAFSVMSMVTYHQNVGREIHVANREEELDTPSYVADDERPEFDNSEFDNDTIYGDGGQSLMIHKTPFFLKNTYKK